MKRRQRLDPLLHLLLGALGVAPAAASCGGTSQHQGGGGGTTGQESLGVCENAVSIGDSGWLRCDNGVVHRESAGQCAISATLPPAANCGGCPDVPNAWCLTTTAQGGNKCVRGCETDADCGSGEVCYCDTPGGRCVAADCSTDADCDNGSLCATYVGPSTPACGFYVDGVACQTEADRCSGDECNCALVNGRRDCVMGLGGCGRPFLIDGAARRADCEERTDWSAADVAPRCLATLDAGERRALAAYFTDIALMEHASIAAFARFSLELVALGAPSELVMDAALAMTDETRHAELAFALASAYAGAPLGPTKLPVDGALAAPTLESVLENVLLEGCIGETVAAAEAQELARSAQDPVVRGVFATIARDEARHAALAYRFVSFAIGHDRELSERVVRRILARELERAGEQSPADGCERGAEEERNLALGIAGAAFRTTLRRDTLRAVVAPCLNAVLGARAAPARAA
ncbi:MAG TPA: ferritin-like domain-containing protein [Polyangiaceae bacterium]|nr:ferritin-like domain-containing protein [Polyangiaceae bacterium]